MKTPAFRRSQLPARRRDERGITMVLVAACMVALIAMAALSIDVVTLYVAREEAQRAADAAALAATRLISVSGITGTADTDNDPAAWTRMCGGSTSFASVMAQAAAQENGVASSAANQVTVTYSIAGGAGSADCTSLSPSTQFAMNPLVTVQVTRTGMPTLFSRIWSRGPSTVSATARAEAFNPSNSGTVVGGGDVVPVTPRCVKPWLIPNTDPATGVNFVLPSSGGIQSPKIVINGGGAGNSGIGEALTLNNACSGSDCSNMKGGTPPVTAPNQTSYVPVLITPPAIAVPPSCANGDYQNAITGCDGNTVYACGVQPPNSAQADLTINPGADTGAAVACMIRKPNQDSLDVSTYPFKIKAGSGNPIFGTSPNQVITSSDSIVSLPIYDSSSNLGNQPKPQVTVVGFLQVFIQDVNSGTGALTVNVLNVAGCGNEASTTLSAPGTSPVPIRLITPQ